MPSSKKYDAGRSTAIAVLGRGTSGVRDTGGGSGNGDLGRSNVDESEMDGRWPCCCARVGGGRLLPFSLRLEVDDCRLREVPSGPIVDTFDMGRSVDVFDAFEASLTVLSGREGIFQLVLSPPRTTGRGICSRLDRRAASVGRDADVEILVGEGGGSGAGTGLAELPVREKARARARNEGDSLGLVRSLTLDDARCNFLLTGVDGGAVVDCDSGGRTDAAEDGRVVNDDDFGVGGGDASGTGLGARLAPSGMAEVERESMLESESGRFAPLWLRPVTGGCDLPGADGLRVRRAASGSFDGVAAAAVASGENGTIPSHSRSISTTLPRSSRSVCAVPVDDGAEPAVALRCRGLRVPSSPESCANGGCRSGGPRAPRL